MIQLKTFKIGKLKQSLNTTIELDTSKVDANHLLCFHLCISIADDLAK